MQKIGYILLCVPVRIVYFFWGLWNRILYPPRIRYADREAKRLFRKTPAILIANHTAHTDGYYLPQTLKKRKLYTYVTRKWYDKRSIHWLFTHLHYIPVDLTGLDTEWLARGEAVLSRGGSILIFPEGKLNPGDMLGAFHPGALMLARKTGVPVIPVALVGDYRRFRSKTILVGAPLALDLARRGRPSLILREETEKCRSALASMLGLPAPLPVTGEKTPVKDGVPATPLTSVAETPVPETETPERELIAAIT